MRGVAVPLALLLLPSFACDPPAPSVDAAVQDGGSDAGIYPDVTPREPGVRAPLTASCSPLEETRCLLPWPSSTFTRLDPSTATGLRVVADLSSINPMDSGARLSEADGFSRVTTLVVAFPGLLDPASFGGPRGGVIRLFNASPSSPDFGEEQPLRIETNPETTREGVTSSALLADPLVVLDPETDYVAVVMDDLRSMDGSELAPNEATLAALALAPPRSQVAADLAGYHAPTRALLAHVGVDPAHVLRVWDFTTRSIENTTAPLVSMVAAAQAAVTNGDVTIVWDVVDHRADGPVATVLEGRLVGLPWFVNDATELETDANGIPMQLRTGEAPFRIVVPRGTGSYRPVLYGHGAAGNFHDDAFDATLAEANVAKVGVQFDGWTDDTLVGTVARLVDLVEGAHSAFAPLMQSTANATAIDTALGSILGEALAAPMLNGAPNPHAGRMIDWTQPTWIGGSLGGTMGLVIASMSEDIQYAVLNVPGAAWSHWAHDSVIFHTFLSAIITRNHGDVNVVTLLAVAQTIFDPADGANFGELSRAGGDIYLIQESMGDQVLPNPGSELVAITSRATQVGTPLSVIVDLPQAPSIAGASGITQYRVADMGLYDVHGFAARDTPAGHAAFDQIQRFLDSAWAGAPLIEVPAGCPGGVCDFPPD
jgi:hypothetical protein